MDFTVKHLTKTMKYPSIFLHLSEVNDHHLLLTPEYYTES